MDKKTNNDVVIYGSLFSALAIFHGPFRSLIEIEPSTPAYSSMLLLAVVSFALIYTMKERDPLGWLFKNFKNNLNHPLIIATEFTIVIHAFLLYQIEWLNMVVSGCFALYFSWVMYQLEKN